MPYNAIREAIKGLVHEGKLTCVEPQLPGEQICRSVFLRKDINDLLTTQDDELGHFHASLHSLLESFVIGHRIAVAMNPLRKRDTATLARTHPPSAEVWDFRCLDPHPGMRAFGRFSEPNVFVCLAWNYRENIDEWPAALTECQEAWRALFGYIPPHSGTRITDYVSSNFYAV